MAPGNESELLFSKSFALMSEDAKICTKFYFISCLMINFQLESNNYTLQRGTELCQAQPDPPNISSLGPMGLFLD